MITILLNVLFLLPSLLNSILLFISSHDGIKHHLFSRSALLNSAYIRHLSRFLTAFLLLISSCC